MNLLSSSDSNASEAWLTFVGVGPGDPSLLTLAAVEAIQLSTVVAYPTAILESEGIALSIASRWITNNQKKIPLLFPMVKEENLLRDSWSKATEQLITEVKKGERVVCLCEGDVSFFSTSSYLLLSILKNHCEHKVRLIPGITSISAAAAIGAWPLALQNDQFLILPTPDNAQTLQDILEEATSLGRVLGLMKLGSRWVWVKPLLERLDLLNKALFAEKVGWPDQLVKPAIEIPAESRPYFSLLLIRQSWPKIMPYS